VRRIIAVDLKSDNSEQTHDWNALAQLAHRWHRLANAAEADAVARRRELPLVAHDKRVKP